MLAAAAVTPILAAAVLLPFAARAQEPPPTRAPEPRELSTAVHLCAGAFFPATEAALAERVARWWQAGRPVPLAEAFSAAPPAGDTRITPETYRMVVGCVLDVSDMLANR